MACDWFEVLFDGKTVPAAVFVQMCLFGHKISTNTLMVLDVTREKIFYF